MRTVTITVHGRVQGVGFRYALRDEAQRAGVRGWVRNRRDGTVEALLSGDPAIVDDVLAWAHHGPPSAAVERVDVAVGSETAPDAFEIRATA
ncbi:acylphosphatase [Microbacterium testaceum]|uniref:acylphosphatase n=1 Tax=Microbacterium testaceum TaxID=2033 RepID=UPI00342BE5B3